MDGDIIPRLTVWQLRFMLALSDTSTPSVIASGQLHYTNRHGTAIAMDIDSGQELQDLGNRGLVRRSWNPDHIEITPLGRYVTAVTSQRVWEGFQELFEWSDRYEFGLYVNEAWGTPGTEE